MRKSVSLHIRTAHVLTSCANLMHWDGNIGHSCIFSSFIYFYSDRGRAPDRRGKRDNLWIIFHIFP